MMSDFIHCHASKAQKFLFLMLVLMVIGYHPSAYAHPYNQRVYSSTQGLSNSAIGALCQTDDGALWVGTCDGLYVFDGNRFLPYPFTDKAWPISGNLINSIFEDSKGRLWIQGNYGLDIIDSRDYRGKTIDFILDNSYIVETVKGDFLIMDNYGHFYFVADNSQGSDDLIEGLALPEVVNAAGVNFMDMLDMVMTPDNQLLLFRKNGTSISFHLEIKDGKASLHKCKVMPKSFEVQYVTHDGNTMYCIDNEGQLYESTTSVDAEPQKIHDIFQFIKENDPIVSIIKQDDNYFIGFQNRGLYILSQEDDGGDWTMRPAQVPEGIFSMLPDKFQDIVWVGTDGGGLYMLYPETERVHCLTFDQLPFNYRTPVRAVYYDPERTLWVGSKGSGIMRIDNFNPSLNNLNGMQPMHLTTANSGLSDDQVFCFARHGHILWIGNNKGLDYYSYATGKIKHFPIESENGRLINVHAIELINDTTLWISTAGLGAAKLSVDVRGQEPKLKDMTHLLMNDGLAAQNYFYCSHLFNDSIVWMGNRGYGLYRVNVKNNRYSQLPLEQLVDNRMANDIFAIHTRNDGFWFGTSAGLVHTSYQTTDTRLYDFGFPASFTIHAIEEDNNGELWISTNHGLVHLNADKENYQIYDITNQQQVVEYSDAASYNDTISSTLFFGGVNGIGIVDAKASSYSNKPYLAPIRFHQLTYDGENHSIWELPMKNGHPEVILRSSNNNLRLNLGVPDYANTNAIHYFYRLDKNSEWIDNGPIGMINLSNIRDGHHTLHVKYYHTVYNQDGPAETLQIYVLPPWYRTIWAYIAYGIILLLLIWLIVHWTRKHYALERDMIITKMDTQQKEAVYESKFHFFTSITHEFCTPLTLISGPCERLINDPALDTHTKKYLKVIEQNTERLKGLIMELLEFRKIETANVEAHLCRLDVSSIVQSTISRYQEGIEQHNLTFNANIESDIKWVTDERGFMKIVNNLISNAYKYTPHGGTIDVSLHRDADKLIFQVKNTCKGIKQENLQEIFDRYKVLENFESDKKNMRTGLGLAIVKGMVDMLQGTINVESKLNDITTFTVTFPTLSLPDKVDDTRPEESEIELPVIEVDNTQPIDYDNAFADPARLTIVVIDDESQIVDFLTEVLSDRYNVARFSRAKQALEYMKTNIPALVISDVRMPEMNGFELARTLKADKLWNHIPLVLLSAYQYEESKAQGFEMGVDAYITKPFSIDYLNAVVNRLMRREQEMDSYYGSIMKSVVVDQESTLTHKENKEFWDKMLAIIEEHITDADLNVEFLSTQLNLSTRQFYRRLKDVTSKSPAEIIREVRLNLAEKLLLESPTVTVEEVMYRTGFVNRGTFYKQFNARYGMSPRKYREEQLGAIEDLTSDRQ